MATWPRFDMNNIRERHQRWPHLLWRSLRRRHDAGDPGAELQQPREGRVPIVAQQAVDALAVAEVLHAASHRSRIWACKYRIQMSALGHTLASPAAEEGDGKLTCTYELTIAQEVAGLTACETMLAKPHALCICLATLLELSRHRCDVLYDTTEQLGFTQLGSGQARRGTTCRRSGGS